MVLEGGDRTVGSTCIVVLGRGTGQSGGSWEPRPLSSLEGGCGGGSRGLTALEWGWQLPPDNQSPHFLSTGRSCSVSPTRGQGASPCPSPTPHVTVPPAPCGCLWRHLP